MAEKEIRAVRTVEKGLNGKAPPCDLNAGHGGKAPKNVLRPAPTSPPPPPKKS